jgi:hypothetical protein
VQAIEPLVDAGFCVRFRCDGSTPEPGEGFNTVADAYSIRDESPEPDHWWSRRPPGSTITIIVWGGNLSGAKVDYESISACPSRGGLS